MRRSPGTPTPERAASSDRSAGADLDPVIALETIEGDGGDPAEGKDADDDVAERAEISVELADEVPERSLQAELIADQAQSLDPADDDGHHHGHEGDGQVVEQLADRLHEGPAIGAQHQDAV